MLISSTPVHRVCVSLQRSSIEGNGAELQYTTQPVGRGGTVFAREQSHLSNPGQPPEGLS